MRLDTVIKSLSVANAAIKNTASPIKIEGWYPTFSASGQDVWLPDYRFDQRGIVVSAVGARCGKAFKADGRWNVCANTHALSIDESIADRDYCWYMLNNESWWIKGGTAQPFVKVKDSLKRDHAFPSLSMQREIVHQLDQINNIICLRKKELEWFDDLVKARFVEMFGNPIVNEKGFETKFGLDVFNLSNGKFVPESKRFENGIPVYGGNGVSWYTDEILFENDTIVVGRVGFQSGNVHLVKGPLWISDNAMYVSNLFDNGFDLRFLYYVMEHIDFTQFQDAGDLKKITQKPFMAMRFIKPPLSMQLDYAAFVAQVDKSKTVVQKALDEAQLLFDSLMQKYFGC